ncbi:MAG: protein-L-isoaspartate O-methyltransferase [Sphingomonadaceae bacterium]|jgi:protein-L-isoaspartate(D-aspartate) O-methyltransferase|nr:protein-L-isoaspartate O-methyltransferase [Sphingomonadaceae bacterium]
MTITAERPGTVDFAAARRAMIDSQLRPSGVNDPAVLEAFASVAREDFVPAAARGHAYIDRAIPLGDGQALAAPLFHGRMLTEAAPVADDRVLVVTGGSGYLAALAKLLAGSVTVITAADAAAGKAKGRFSLVLVDGAIEQLPDSLSARLEDAGRLVTGLVERGVTRLAIGRKAAGAVALLPLAEMGIPVLAEFAAPKRWSF